MRWLVIMVAALLPLTQTHAAQPAADAVVLAFQDARRLAPDEARYTRYLWISDATTEDRRRTWAACAGLVNALSLSRRIVSPVLVLADGTAKRFTDMADDDWKSLVLLRVNLQDYHQSTTQWDKLGNPNLEPIFHIYTVVPYPAGTNADGSRYRAGEERVKAMAPWLIQPLGATDEEAKKYLAALVGLVTVTGYSQCPIVEGRNFVWQASINFDRGGAGYYSWLGIKDQASFDKLVRRQKGLATVRDAVKDSGVAKEPRIVEREGRGDGYWRTLDQVAQRGQGRRNALSTDNLDPDMFQFDAQEVFGRLDNDWWATLLADNKGVLQDSAPDGVGYNHRASGNDGKIHVFLSCFGCHDKKPGNGGLHPFTPYFRNKYATPGPLALGTAASKKVFSRFEDLYLTPMDNRGNADRLAYAAAVAEATGLTPDRFAAALVGTFNAWDAGRTIDDVAHEHGIKTADMVTALQATLLKTGTLDSVNDDWLIPKERQKPLGVSGFCESYSALELALRGLAIWSTDTKQKLRPWVKEVVK